MSLQNQGEGEGEVGSRLAPPPPPPPPAGAPAVGGEELQFLKSMFNHGPSPGMLYLGHAITGG